MYLPRVEKTQSWEAHLHRIKFESFPIQVKEIRGELSEIAKKSAIVYIFHAWFHIAFQLINASKHKNTIRSICLGEYPSIFSKKSNQPLFKRVNDENNMYGC